MEAIYGQLVVKRQRRGLEGYERRAVRSYLHSVLLEPRADQTKAERHLDGIHPSISNYAKNIIARNLSQDIPEEIAKGRHKGLDGLAFHREARSYFVSFGLRQLAFRHKVYDYLVRKIERAYGISYLQVITHAITKLDLPDFFNRSTWEALFYISGRIQREIWSLDMGIKFRTTPELV